jgi:N-acetylglutamate synthase-like GNAT family acetyltransferase
MARPTVPTCLTRTPGSDTAPGGAPARDDKLIALARQPWTVQAAGQVLLVRPATTRDLTAVAQLHRRCSAQSLLDRYHAGGRPPAVAALDRELRSPYTFVAATSDGRVVATASLRSDLRHDVGAAEVGLLVEDGWQRNYLGTELLLHLAGVAKAAGFVELVSYPATAVAVAKRLMIEVGRSRFVPGADAHLHTALQDSATLGLGSVRQRLAG